MTLGVDMSQLWLTDVDCSEVAIADGAVLVFGEDSGPIASEENEFAKAMTGR
jgi:hypothetical protein